MQSPVRRRAVLDPTSVRCRAVTETTVGRLLIFEMRIPPLRRDPRRVKPPWRCSFPRNGDKLRRSAPSPGRSWRRMLRRTGGRSPRRHCKPPSERWRHATWRRRWWRRYRHTSPAGRCAPGLRGHLLCSGIVDGLKANRVALRAVVDALVHGLRPVVFGMVSHVDLLLHRGRESARPQHRPLLLLRINAVRRVRWFRRDGPARPYTAAGVLPGPPCPANRAAFRAGPGRVRPAFLRGGA